MKHIVLSICRLSLLQDQTEGHFLSRLTVQLLIWEIPVPAFIVYKSFVIVFLKEIYLLQFAGKATLNE